MVTDPHPADSAASDSLANRYGGTSHVRSHRTWFTRKGLIIASIGLVVAIAFTFWVTFSATSDRLDYKDVGFTLHDEFNTSVRFQVTKEPDRSVECAVQALAENYAVVGWSTVKIVAEEPDATQQSLPSEMTQYYDVDLRTDASAVNGSVHSCWYSESGPRIDRFQTEPQVVG